MSFIAPRRGACRPDRLRAHWPAVLAGVALLAGIFVVTIRVTGLTSHTPFGRFVRNRLFLRHLG
jgi:hypothetical protein